LDAHGNPATDDLDSPHAHTYLLELAEQNSNQRSLHNNDNDSLVSHGDFERVTLLTNGLSRLTRPLSIHSFSSQLRKQARKMRKTYVASDHPTDGDPKMAFSPEAALQISGKSPTAWDALMDSNRGRATKGTPFVFMAQPVMISHYRPFALVGKRMELRRLLGSGGYQTLGESASSSYFTSIL
jgi:hypothetical protein